jgi:hypothetical protein
MRRFPLIMALLVWGLIGGDLSDSQEYTYSTIAQTASLGVEWIHSFQVYQLNKIEGSIWLPKQELTLMVPFSALVLLGILPQFFHLFEV